MDARSTLKWIETGGMSPVEVAPSVSRSGENPTCGKTGVGRGSASRKACDATTLPFFI
jgi:hypothetical protein